MNLMAMRSEGQTYPSVAAGASVRGVLTADEGAATINVSCSVATRVKVTAPDFPEWHRVVGLRAAFHDFTITVPGSRRYEVEATNMDTSTAADIHVNVLRP